MHRFYLSNLQHLVLSAAEAHHAIHVLRLKEGDSVNVFDGRGHEAQCAVSAIAADSVRLKLLAQSNALPLPCRITLAQAVPKKNMDLILQKATELGVSAILPLISERTIVQLDEQDTKKIERWQAICLDACKQSGNNWLPELQPPQKAREFFGALEGQPRAFDLKLQFYHKKHRELKGRQVVGSSEPLTRWMQGRSPASSHLCDLCVLCGSSTAGFRLTRSSLARSLFRASLAW
jgi:RsmE family RNA methyltransferase